MMIKYMDLLCGAKHAYCAVSGGVDSIVASHFLTKYRRISVTPIFFNHGNEEHEEEELRRIMPDLVIGRSSRPRNKGESMEEYWRRERRGFFRSFDGPVITGHHLDDAVETFIFSSLHGTPKLIPFHTRNILHPFLLSTKDDILQYAQANGLKWIEDESNKDTRFMRNKIRHEMLPIVLQVNPGIRKTVRKKYLKLLEEQEGAS